MSYQALYRRFRPQRFDDVRGQEHIVTILKNQVRSGAYSHAYMLSGSRGTGKTSVARIFARSVNCLSPADGEACGVCEACVHSRDENAVDIVEIDAASNNSVDDIRVLIEKARFMPLKLRYKVYIIDEVHMLSNAASNALLKTLEEPPAHVIFLLATTEPQKLPPTIVSRCQRLEFRRLTVADILEVLRSVLRDAGAHIDEGGLIAIARAADGGMRDALSLADQCLAFCGDEVSEQDVYDVLGSMRQDVLFDMTDALIGGDAARALRAFDALLRDGRDMAVFAQDLTQHMRALLLAKTCGDCADLLDCTEDAMARYLAQAASCSDARLLRALDLLTKAQNDMKWLRQPRALIETTLVHICRPEEDATLLAVEDRLARLEEAAARFGNGQAPAPAPARETAPAPPIPAPAKQPAVPLAEDAPPWETTAPAPVQKQPAPEPPASPAVPAPAAAPAGERRLDPAWEALLAKLQKTNLPTHVLAANAHTALRDENMLTAAFAPLMAHCVDALSTPKNTEILRNALNSIEPGLQLRLVVRQVPATDPKTLKMMSVFGDKLNIEN